MRSEDSDTSASSVTSEPRCYKRRKVVVQKQPSKQTKHVAALEVCDLIKAQVRDRFSFTDHLQAALLVCPSKFANFNMNFPDQILETTVKHFTQLNKIDLRRELRLLYKRDEMRDR